jgi:hypothetical protein
MLQNTIDLFRQAPPGLGLAVGAVFIGLFLVLLRLARPKPIPGIPHNVEAANSFFGDLPEFRTAPDRREWWVSQVIKHQSPMIQVFLRPFSLPWVFVADHWEAVDIMTHRAKEFDRADQTIYTFEGVAPSHHIVMHSSNPQFKRNKELVRDLMSVNFLQDVGIMPRFLDYSDFSRFLPPRFTKSLPFLLIFGITRLVSPTDDRLTRLKTSTMQPLISSWQLPLVLASNNPKLLSKPESLRVHPAQADEMTFSSSSTCPSTRNLDASRH